jgi:hypothetical protein
LEYLKQFQVIVWNNNTGNAVPSVMARQAVLDYVDQGGGWMLICFAGDHKDAWPGLAERLGTKIAHWSPGSAEVVLDPAARAHGELNWMVQGFPAVFRLKDMWFAFNKTVRPLPGVTVVATSRAVPGIPDVVTPPRDGSGDNVYIWAREVGQGRLLYNTIGFGGNNLMGQLDSIVPRLYWENLRYAAGDYQNGCTNPAMPNFNPEARVDDGSCPALGIRANPRQKRISAGVSGGRVRFNTPVSGGSRLRMLDLRGHTVWTSVAPVSADAIDLPDGLRAGLYILEGSGMDMSFHAHLLVP